MNTVKMIDDRTAFDDLLDLLPRIDPNAKNLSLLGGTGGGWPARLAFNPSAVLRLKGSQATPRKLVDFVDQQAGKLIVGFISYNFGYQLHGLSPTKPDDLGLPDIYFLAYDNFLEEVDKPSENLTNTGTTVLDEKFRPITSRNDYGQAFDKTIDYIKSGHIYQLNLSHRLQAKSSQNSRSLFRQIAKNNQASMMGYIEAEDFELLSISPERFVKIDSDLITTTPIKGTARRAKNTEKQLLGSLKEQSELSMITDLLRNDLAKVSQAGSVKVKKPRTIQKLTSVVHTFSEISANLKSGISPIEALLAMFPGGSITGCPKRRAMQIIDELEATSRGAYCGCMVRIDPDGRLDCNILIRTVIKQGQNLTLPVGGGIVFDSNKSAEYQETLDKAQSIIDALN